MTERFDQKFKERQKSVQSMSEAQFREFIMQQLEAGRVTMVDLHESITENTRLTKENMAATATIVSIVSFSENSAKRVVKIGRFMSMAAKILLPIVMLYGTVVGIAHGKFPTWKDLIP